MAEVGRVVDLTWGEVKVGDTVLDKTGRMHIVQVETRDEVLLLSAHPVGEVWINRPSAERAVQVYRPSEQEALVLLQDELGARLLRDIEEREHTLARRAHFRVDPIKRTATALRDHISWLHGFNVDDVWRKHAGTDANPSDKERKKASIEELCQAHDEAHERPDIWPHDIPHHHAPKEN